MSSQISSNSPVVSRSKKFFILVVMLSSSLTGCASITSIPLGLLYTNTRSPRAYRSATPADVKSSPADPLVTGEGCSRSVLYLVAWGDNGYARAVKNALHDKPNAFLYDVRVDSRSRSFLLGLYSDTCTVLTGRVGETG